MPISLRQPAELNPLHLLAALSLLLLLLLLLLLVALEVVVGGLDRQFVVHAAALAAVEVVAFAPARHRRINPAHATQPQ